MFIVKRINHLPGWDTLPSGEKIDKVLGIVDNVFDAEALFDIMEHDINKNVDSDSNVVAEHITGSKKVVVHADYDQQLVWYTIELEEVEHFDREYIEANSARALDEAEDNLAKSLGII